MSNNDVFSATEEAKKSFDAANAIITAMKDGERKQIKDLVIEVAAVLNTEAKEVIGFVNHYAHHNNDSYVTRGKKGGLIKGSRPVKVVKVKKAKKTDTADSSQ